MGDSTQNFTGTFPKPLLDALRELARRHDRSINKELNRAVRAWVTTQAKRTKATPTAEEAVS